MKVGFIGLGNMGQAMSKHLLEEGFELAVYNRTRAKAEEMQKHGASIAASIADLASSVEAVITMVANDQAMKEVFYGQSGDGLLSALKPDSLHISMSTLSPSLVQEMAAAQAQKKQKLVSATVVGRPEAAAAKKLWIIAAGNPDAIEKCQKLFAAFGQGVVNAGAEAHLSNVVKVANNFMIAAFLQTFSEAYALTQKAGVDKEVFFQLISNALLRSPIFENYARRILDRGFEPAGFNMHLGLKDINLVLDTAEKAEVPMPFASLLHDAFLSAIGHGMGDLDWSALSLLVAQNSGLGEQQGHV